jgi:hypothetical protein
VIVSDGSLRDLLAEDSIVVNSGGQPGVHGPGLDVSDLQDLFEQQAEWQRSRANLPWAEKLRLSVVMREALLALRRSHHNESHICNPDEQPKHANR